LNNQASIEEAAQEIKTRVVHRMAPVLVYLYNATPQTIPKDLVTDASKLVTHFVAVPTLGDAHSVTEGLHWLEAAVRGEQYTLQLQDLPALPSVPQEIKLDGGTTISVA